MKTTKGNKMKKIINNLKSSFKKKKVKKSSSYEDYLNYKERERIKQEIELRKNTTWKHFL